MHVAQQRRRKVQPARWNRNRRLPASRPFSHALIHQLLNAFQLHPRDDGADVDSLIQRRPDAQMVHALANLGNQRFRDALLHQQARPRAAHLSLVEPDAVHQPLDGTVQVRILKNNERRLASEFE